MTPPPSPEELLRHAPFLRKLALSLVRDEQSANDLVQETWLTALERPPRHQQNLGAWLRVVTTTHAFRGMRTRRRRDRREAEAARPEREPSTAEKVERRQVFSTVTDAVQRLGDPYREVLLLRFFEDLPPRHIAERLDRPINTVNSQLKRGLQKVRAEMDEFSNGDRTAWTMGLVTALGTLEPLPGGDVGLGGGGAPAPAEWTPGSGTATVGSKVFLGSLIGLALITIGWLGWGAGLPESNDAPIAGRDAGLAAVAESTPLSAVPAGRTPIEPTGGAAAGGGGRPATESGGPDQDPPLGHRERRLEVLVVDADGAPVSGATVAIADYGPSTPENYGYWHPRGLTDDQGRVLVAATELNVAQPRGVDAEEPRVGIVVFAQGFVASEAHYLKSDPGTLARVRIQLDDAPSVTIRGRVLGPDGTPFPNAKVVIANVDLEPRHTDDGVLLTAAPLERLTGRDGSFELTNLRRARHLLFATGASCVPSWSWQDATEAEVVECVFHLHPGGRVTGVVRDEKAQPVPRADVWFEHAAGSAPKMVLSGADGSYSLEGLPPGEHQLWARLPNRPELMARAILRVGVGAELTWDPILRQVEGLRLRLADPRGEPLAGWFVRLEAVDQSQPWVRRLNVDDEGRLAVFDCPEGAIRADLFPSSIVAQARNFPVHTVDGLRPSARERKIVVRDETGSSGTITGTLADAQGRTFEEAHLYVRELRGAHARKFPVEPGTGVFSIGQVPPGRYQIRAWCGLAGSTDLSMHRVAKGATLDLGLVRTPPPGRLAVDWYWPDDAATFSFQLVSREDEESEDWVQWSIDEGQWSMDEGLGRPRGAYALLPGTYGLQVVRDGVVLERELARIVSGAEERLAIGPERRSVSVRVTSRAGRSEDGEARLVVTALEDTDVAREGEVISSSTVDLVGGTGESTLELADGLYGFEVTGPGDSRADTRQRVAKRGKGIVVALKLR